MSGDSDRTGPLAGIRVLDVTRVWSGPLASGILGDLGADVIRVELPYGRDGDVPPEIPGTGLSWFRETVNRNKRSVGLDLRQDEGRLAFLRLVRTADLVVENYRPGTLERWGVGYEQCRAHHPGVVFVSISGWGREETHRDRPAYDPVVQAASGWMALNGPPGGAPVRAPTFLADELAGLYAAIGALAALGHRDRTGEGQHVDVAMFDCLFASTGLATLAAAGAAPRRIGNETEFAVPSNTYECRDGHVYLAVALDKHWRALTEVLGRPELARAPGYARRAERIANRAAVNRLVGDWCGSRTTAEAAGILGAAGLVVAPVVGLAEAVTDPVVTGRGLLREVELSNGTRARLVAPPLRFSRTPAEIRRPAPVAGADTEEILGALAAPAIAEMPGHDAG